MEKTVSFKISKLLKEKGFDKSVRYSYGHKINPHIAYPNENYFIPVNFNSITVGLNYKNLYSAPTITEVVMWLYEKHGIWIWVERLKVTNISCWQFNVDKNHELIECDYKLYWKEPTEAYESAIEYTLNNLI